MTRVKVCGITNLEDARRSVEFGTDMLGFNFYRKSPRFIEAFAAREIIENLRTVSMVGVFVNEPVAKIVEIAKVAGLNWIQLHGDESAQFVDDLRKETDCEIVKAMRVTEGFRCEEVLEYKNANAILLDAYSPNERGGSGQTFDWEIAKSVRSLVGELWLAGGLTPENVRDAIIGVGPSAVDACSSLESRPGVKDAAKLRRFIMEAKNDD